MYRSDSHLHSAKPRALKIFLRSVARRLGLKKARHPVVVIGFVPYALR